MSGERASFDDDDSKDELIQNIFNEAVSDWVATLGYSINGISDIFLDTLTTQTMWVRQVGNPTLEDTDINVQYAQESLSDLREMATDEARAEWLDVMGDEGHE